MVGLRARCWFFAVPLLIGGPLSLAQSPRPDPPTGTITGTIRYTGAVPAPQKIATTDGTVILHSDLVVDAKSKGLRDVVLVVETVPAQPKPPKSDPVIIDQREQTFVPRVAAVRHGQAVEFLNSDSFNHAVQANSLLPENSFNTITPPARSYEHSFVPQKHPVPIGCPIHPWMRAWVYVVPHSCFAVSDARGSFTIKDVPAGRHTVWVRHADTGRQERRSVEVRAGAITRVEVEWKTAKP
jgi:plastocyanin